MDANRLLDEVYRMSAQTSFKLYHIWAGKIVFSWRWWVQVALAIIPWIVWVKIRDKNNTARLMFVGLVVGITSNILDVVGGSYNLWHYDWKVFPMIPVYLPWDFTLFPVIVMIMLQIKPKWKAFYKAIAFAFFCSFVFEPLFSLLGMYHILHWKYYYSFGIYIPLFIFYNYLYKSKMWQSQTFQ